MKLIQGIPGVSYANFDILCSRIYLASSICKTFDRFYWSPWESLYWALLFEAYEFSFRGIGNISSIFEIMEDKWGIDLQWLIVYLHIQNIWTILHDIVLIVLVINPRWRCLWKELLNTQSGEIAKRKDTSVPPWRNSALVLKKLVSSSWELTKDSVFYYSIIMPVTVSVGILSANRIFCIFLLMYKI